MQTVQHHIKYKEIHGIDEIVLMPRGEHRALHNKLRKEGKCKICIDELHKIALRAHQRTFESIRFDESVGENMRLWEWIKYNLNTGNVTYGSGLIGNHGKQTQVIDI